MIFAVEKTYFRGDVLGTFPFSTDVSTEKKLLFFVVGRRAAKYQRILRMSCVPF